MQASKIELIDWLSGHLLDSSGALDDKNARELIDLSPYHFFNALKINDLPASKIDPIYIQSALEKVLSLAEENHSSATPFLERLSRGHYKNWVDPVLSSLENRPLRERLQKIAKGNMHIEHLSLYALLTNRNKGIEFLDIDLITRELKHKTTLIFASHAADFEGFAAKRYTSFLKQGRMAAGIVEFLIETNGDILEKLPSSVKDFTFASQIIQDLEKTIAGDAVESNSLIDAFFEADYQGDADFIRAFNLAYSLFAENIELYGEHVDDLQSALESAALELQKGYEALYEDCLFMDKPVRVENAWASIITPEETGNVISLSARKRGPEARK